MFLTERLEERAIGNLRSHSKGRQSLPTEMNDKEDFSQCHYSFLSRMIRSFHYHGKHHHHHHQQQQPQPHQHEQQQHQHHHQHEQQQKQALPNDEFSKADVVGRRKSDVDPKKNVHKSKNSLVPGGGGKVIESNVLSLRHINQLTNGRTDSIVSDNLSRVTSVNVIAKNGMEIKTVKATFDSKGASYMKEISYANERMIGNGSFGVVYQATLLNGDKTEVVAIKRVLQDRRFKNRELNIMVSLDHCNIVRLKYYFYTCKTLKEGIYLNLVLEFIPDTVSKVARYYMRQGQKMPMIYIKLYMYQLFRSLAYIHSLGVCHRDIKPQNLLVNPLTGVLKLCDFGSAKHLVRGEINVSYICSRYYRAPELIFGATDYTTKIDIWSAGCVFAELLLGYPIFSGESGVDQLVEIIKVLGTPSKEQIRRMNRHYTEFKFPKISANPWDKVFGARTPPEVIDLVSRLLDYTPFTRLDPLKACTHKFFDDLRNPNTKLPNDRELPPLFNFRSHELKVAPELNAALIPPHLHSQFSQYLTNSQEQQLDSTTDPKLAPQPGSPLSDLDDSNEPKPSTSLAGVSSSPTSHSHNAHFSSKQSQQQQQPVTSTSSTMETKSSGDTPVVSSGSMQPSTSNSVEAISNIMPEPVTTAAGGSKKF